jgi:DNA polymerase-3 subunit alpha
MITLIGVDFETTGLLDNTTEDFSKQPGIVEIGLVKYQYSNAGGGLFLEESNVDKRINPEIPVWDPKAIEVHGIQPEQVKDEPTLAEYLPELATYFAGATYWVGANCDFDKDVLYYQLHRYGWRTRFPWPRMTIDVLKIGKDVANIQGKSDSKFPSLTELHEHLFGQRFDGAHGAKQDVYAATRCAIELWKRGYIFL